MEGIYDNGEASVILFKCRSNNMNLGDRRRFYGEPQDCIMCGGEKEDLNHFLLHCPAYMEERRKSNELQQPYQLDEDVIIGNLLFITRNLEENKQIIYKFWKIRQKKVREKER